MTYTPLARRPVPHFRLRQGSRDDLEHIEAIAGRVHPVLSERRAVFEEKINLYEAGCLIAEDRHGAIGYAIAHPWRLGHVPHLDTFLGQLPPDSNCLFVHDVALLVEGRGYGVGRRMVERLSQQSSVLSLVSVYDSRPFWDKLKFKPAPCVSALECYGDGAAYMIRT